MQYKHIGRWCTKLQDVKYMLDGRALKVPALKLAHIQVHINL